MPKNKKYKEEDENSVEDAKESSKEKEKEEEGRILPSATKKLNVNLMGEGGGNKQGVGGGGRLSVSKDIGKNSSIEAYMDAWGYKPKDGKPMGGVSGGGVSYRRSFAKGGVVTANCGASVPPAQKRKK